MGEFGVPTRFASFSKVKMPESGSANDWGDRGEVGGMELLLPMLRLGDGSRFPSLGREPLVFIRGP